MAKYIVSLLVAFSSISALAAPMAATSYPHKPKLVLVLVIDQFRSDMITRNFSSFMPAGTSKAPGGFRYLMNQGAWFPFAEYGALQDMTCPGHATILSGSHPASTGIILNDWFDRKKNKLVYCAQDDKDGLSPRRLKTTTFGDELKAVNPKSRVYAFALKDRSSIMLGGHRADLAMWVDESSGRWATSTYYSNDLPAWAKVANEELAKGPPPTRKEPTPLAGVKDETAVIQTALAALKNEKLGQKGATDVLAVSLSYHDILGHQIGPDAKDLRDFTVAEDKLVSLLLKGVAKELGSLDDVVIAMTADHGVAPDAKMAAADWKLDAAVVDGKAVGTQLGTDLQKAFGTKKSLIAGGYAFQYYLDHAAIAEAKLDAEKVEKEAKRLLLQDPSFLTVFTKSEVDAGNYPAGVVGQQVRNAYVRDLTGDIVAVLKPFHYQKGSLTTHMTGWSYDRSVPLILVGKPFKPGVYSGAGVVDLAPTLSFVMGVLPPAMSEGKVLNEAIR